MSIKQICRCGLMAALMFAFQVALSGVPNVEVVSIITVVGTMVFGWEMLLTTEVFALLEIVLWGFGLWNLMYLYIWPALVVVVMLSRKLIKKYWIVAPAINGVYGMLFGALCAIPYLTCGWTFAVTWWLNGLPFDVVHCIGNIVSGVILYKPLYEVLSLVKRRM